MQRCPCWGQWALVVPQTLQRRAPTNSICCCFFGSSSSSRSGSAVVASMVSSFCSSTCCCCYRRCFEPDRDANSSSNSVVAAATDAADKDRGSVMSLKRHSRLLLLLLLQLQLLHGLTAATSLQQQVEAGSLASHTRPAAAAAAAIRGATTEALLSAEKQQQQQQQATVAFAAAPLRQQQGCSSRQHRLLESSPKKQRAAATAAGSSSCLFGNCCFSGIGPQSDAARSSDCCGGNEGASPAAGGADTPQVPRVGTSSAGPRPDWFHVPAPRGEGSRFALLSKQIRGLKLHTVCEEAKCPNIGECWEGGTATLMLLGDTCTRGCRFCAIKTSAKPPPPDPEEPRKVAEAVAQWSIDYIVLTSVWGFAFRDDLPDGGAAHFAETVRRIKELKPEMLVECLVSDFQGMRSSVEALALSGLDVYAHNVETVPRLSPFVRDRRASFPQSLSVLRLAKTIKRELFTKTSLMLGLGETEAEVKEALKEIREAGVDAVTLGQYLRPTQQHLGVVAFISPQQFEVYRHLALDLGFKYVASGPLTRSSYKAGEFYLASLLRKKTAKLQADVGPLSGDAQQVLHPKAK
ncbi:hypothetical protein Esti_005419 [Eimeria stiedai]